MFEFNKKRVILSVCAAVIFSLDFLFVRTAQLISDCFGHLSVSQLFFHLIVPMKRAETAVFMNKLNMVFVLTACILAAALVLFYFAFKFILKSRKKTFILQTFWIITGVVTIISYALFNEKIPFSDFLNMVQSTEMFTEHFANVPVKQVKFPVKRNVILLIVESLEESYEHSEVAGENLIPELTNIRKQNLSFSRQVQPNGTEWTLAALAGIFYGIPQLPLVNMVWANQENNRSYNCNSIFHYFLDAGYNCTYMQGGHMSFAGKSNLFINLPEVNIISYDQLCKDPVFQKNTKPFSWGVDDEVLFRHLYKETERCAAGDKPFFISLLTLDTHEPNGYIPPDRFSEEDSFYAQVMKNADRRISEFVKWVSRQEFAKDTTLIIVGDHLAMKNEFLSSLRKFNGGNIINGKRRAYNCFINPAKNPAKSENRIFSAFDLMPTILHAAGAEWGTDKMNLGVSVFGEIPTLLEKNGIGWYETHSRRFQKKYIDLLEFH